MPKAESSNPNKGGPSFQGPRQRPNWTAALLCFILGPCITVALIDYNPGQVTFNTTTQVTPETANIVGNYGANAVWSLYFTVGVAAWLIPAFLLFSLYLALRAARRLSGARTLAMLICVCAVAGLATMFEQAGEVNQDWLPTGRGGLVGRLLYDQAMHETIGPFGSGLLLGTVFLSGLVFVVTRDIGGQFAALADNFTAWREARARRKAEAAEERKRARDATAAVKSKTEPSRSESRAPWGPVGPTGTKINIPKAGAEPLAKPPQRPEAVPAPVAKPPVPVKVPTPEPKLAKAEPAPKPLAAPGKIDLHIVKSEAPKKAKVTVPQSTDEDYKFPPLTLLKEHVKPNAEDSEEEHRRNAENLLRILSEFGVEVTLGEIHVGPVITRYEVVPAPGVRVEKIAGLDKNIALGMRAQSVRILAPIPGKAAVGVEVPNQHPTPVGLREILESEDWNSAKADLPIALGKDVSGKPLVSDLTKMPHLLIAGATGSGKSVGINSIIASILYSKGPKDVRLLMVDPKMVELKIFNSLPHMLVPVVTEAKKVPGALKVLLAEMEKRYQIFAKENVRNITGFNNRKKAPKPESAATEAQAPLPGVEVPRDAELEVPDRLPYIVLLIDELADLMMVAPAEIETNIARLAQLARAAGIHVIIATQRPSVNVITGVIKANLPSRIAFQVASQVDSRTIIDGKGAETLIGRGDMLFSPPGSSKLIRAQGAFVSDEEVQGLVDYLKEKNAPPVYSQEVQDQIDRAAREDDEEGEVDGEDGELGDDEELFRQALDVLKSTRRASTSMLQRRLRIGYNRAARIMEIMEEKGIVGPENGSNPREILADLDKL